MKQIRLYLLVAILGSWAASCSMIRTVRNTVPLIPNTPTDEAIDPDKLQVNRRKDAVVLKLDYRGQTRRVVIQLYPERAPITVANFQRLVENGYYEGQAFHRVIPNYLVQTGDPKSKDLAERASWGLGGPEHTLPPEVGLGHRPGAVAMARLPDERNPRRRSSGSQFYVALGNLSALNGKYSVFGQVIQGYAVLQDLSELPADENDNPYQRVEIKSAELARSSSFAAEDIAALQRQGRRKSLQELPNENPSRLGRLWRRIW